LLVFLMMPLLLACSLGVVAHYANVIEDIGPDQRDELPRFLRNLSIHDDLWRPFVNFAASCMYCFWPLLILWHFQQIASSTGLVLAGGLVAAGSLFFPAVLLTATTSGSMLNLRPDRVLGTIKVIGMSYMLLVAALVLVEIFYSVGLLTTSLNAFVILDHRWTKSWLAYGPLAYSIMCGAIYLMHYFCWQLGLAYRRDHHRFPWVLQRHISERAPAQLASSRAPLPDDMRG
jgi:hypothetical protein